MKELRYRLFFVYFLIAFSSVSCTGTQQNLPTKSFPNPSLEELLANQGDFSGNWEWTLVYSDKDAMTPDPKANLADDSAISHLEGHIIRDNETYTFTFTHYVRLYDLSTPNASLPFTDNMLPEPFPIHPMKVGDSIETRCSRAASTKPDPIFLCEILVQYKTVISFLRITGEVSAGEQPIENIIDQLLTSIDARIKASQ